MDIPEAAVDRAHRTGLNYLEKFSKKNYKSILVRFTTFRHRKMFYRAAKRKLKKGVKVRLHLMKWSFVLLKNDHVKEIPAIKFCFEDVNCCLKLKLNEQNQKDLFILSFDDLCDVADTEVEYTFFNVLDLHFPIYLSVKDFVLLSLLILCSDRSCTFVLKQITNSSQYKCH